MCKLFIETSIPIERVIFIPTSWEQVDYMNCRKVIATNDSICFSRPFNDSNAVTVSNSSNYFCLLYAHCVDFFMPSCSTTFTKYFSLKFKTTKQFVFASWWSLWRVSLNLLIVQTHRISVITTTDLLIKFLLSCTKNLSKCNFFSLMFQLQTEI